MGIDEVQEVAGPDRVRWMLANHQYVLRFDGFRRIVIGHVESGARDGETVFHEGLLAKAKLVGWGEDGRITEPEPGGAPVTLTAAEDVVPTRVLCSPRSCCRRCAAASRTARSSGSSTHVRAA